MAGIFDKPARLPEKCRNPADTDLAAYLKRITPYIGQTRSVGFLQLLVEHIEVRCVLPEGNVRPPPPPKKNDWAFNYLPKIDRKLLLGEHLETTCNEGKIKGIFAFGMNGRDDRSGFEQEYRRTEEGRLAGWSAKSIPTRPASFWRAPGITPEDMKKIKHDRSTVSPALVSLRKTVPS